MRDFASYVTVLFAGFLLGAGLLFLSSSASRARVAEFDDLCRRVKTDLGANIVAMGNPLQQFDAMAAFRARVDVVTACAHLNLDPAHACRDEGVTCMTQLMLRARDAITCARCS